MTAKKHKVGDTVDLEHGVTVEHPNGEKYVAGGPFVLDTAGTYVVDGKDVEVS